MTAARWAPLLLLLAAAAALLLRLGDLAALPLNGNEAREALAVFHFWQPADAPVLPGSPLYFALTALLAAGGNFGDGMARLVPALAGSALALSPWWLRRQIGPVAALIAIFWLVASPVQAIVSRTAGGEALALLCGVGLVAAWLNGRTRLAAVAAGLGLATAPLFWSALAVIGAVAFFGRWRSPNLSLTPPRPFWLWLAGSALAGSTLFLWHPAGLGQMAALFPAWLADFGVSGGAWRFLLRSYPFGLLLLLPAVGMLWIRPNRAGNALVVAAGVAALLGVLQGGAVAMAALIEWPLVLLIALWAAHAADTLTNRDGRLVVLAGVIWGMLALVQIGRFTRIPENWMPVLLTALLLVVIVLLTIAWSNDPALVGKALSLALAVLALYVGWGLAWNLTRHTANDPRALWVQEGSSPALRTFTTILGQVGWELRQNRGELTLVSVIDHPVLRWYLRDLAQVRFADGFAADSRPDGAITPLGMTAPLEGSVGSTDLVWLQRQGERVPPAQEPPPAQRLADGLRTRLYGDTLTPLMPERLTLWVATDPSR